jgi:hypothetical protein
MESRTAVLIACMLATAVLAGCAGGTPPETTVTVTQTVTHTPGTTTGTTSGPDEGNNPNYTGPSITWSKDENEDRLTITARADGADWRRIEARVTSCSTNQANLVPRIGGTSPPYYNARAMPTGGPLTEESIGSSSTQCAPQRNVAISGSSVGIQNGHYIEFCLGHKDRVSPPASATMTNVVVELFDTGTSAVQSTWVFSNLHRCT